VTLKTSAFYLEDGRNRFSDVGIFQITRSHNSRTLFSSSKWILEITIRIINYVAAPGLEKRDYGRGDP
jgi:hypothetical protein